MEKDLAIGYKDSNPMIQKESIECIGGERSSNFELFRIILMLLIIAHHYTVNSGLTQLYNFEDITANMIFLQIFGMFGDRIRAVFPEGID